MTQLQLAIAFDDRLEEMASIATSRDASNRMNYENLAKKDRKKFYFMRGLLVLVYFVFVPFCQAPGWCLAAASKADMGFG